MKEIYDKLLLGLAFLALLAGVGIFFLLQSSVAASTQPLTDAQLQGEEFQQVNPPEISAPSRIWEEPEEQSTEWRFFVFTAPKIYYNTKTEEFTRDPIYDIRGPATPFGVILVNMERQVYRLVLRATYGEKPNSPLSIEDTSTGQYLGSSGLAKAGNTYQDARVEILKYEITKRADPTHGDIIRTAVVTVRDLDLNETFELKEGEQIILEDKQTIVFQPMSYDNKPVGSKITLTNAGESFTHLEATYTLKEISFDNQQAVVEKVSPLLDEPKIKILKVESPPTESKSPTKNSNSPSQSAPFDSIFNN